MLSKFKTSFLIITGFLLILAITYFGFTYYKNYQIQREKQKNERQDRQTSEVGKLKEEIENLKNQKSQTVVKEILSPQPQIKDLSEVIKEWRPTIAYIECEFRYNDNRTFYGSTEGSGFLVGFHDGTAGIFTNRHVVDMGWTAYFCTAKLPENDYVYQFTYLNKDIRVSSLGDDWGELHIDYPDEYIKNTNFLQSPTCSKKPSVGDEIVVLGYPTIGSQTDITATKGIISGYDGDYYITDAKIEHGNSGGVAILLKDDCWLGIPAYVLVGEVESLARILDWNVIFK